MEVLLLVARSFATKIPTTAPSPMPPMSPLLLGQRSPTKGLIKTTRHWHPLTLTWRLTGPDRTHVACSDQGVMAGRGARSLLAEALAQRTTSSLRDVQVAAPSVCCAFLTRNRTRFAPRYLCPRLVGMSATLHVELLSLTRALQTRRQLRMLHGQRPDAAGPWRLPGSALRASLSHSTSQTSL